MVTLLLIAHAPLASSLKAVAQHVYPSCGSTIHALDVEPHWSLEEAERRALSLYEGCGRPEALVFSDVFGATPCKAAQSLVDGVRVRLVTGVNVPMLWRALCYGEESVESLATRAVSGAVQGVMQVTPSRPPTQQSSPLPHDPVQHPHQQ